MKEKSEKLDLLLKKALRKPRARYTVKAILYSRAGYEGQKKWKHDGVTYYQVTVRSYDVIAPKPFPDEVYRKHIIDYEGNDLWDTAFKIMITNKDFKELFERGYIEVIYIMDYDIIPTSGKRYKPTEEQLLDPMKISMYNTYIKTTINIPSETLREA